MAKGKGRFVDRETGAEVEDPLQLEEWSRDAEGEFWESFHDYRAGKTEKVVMYRKFLKYKDLNNRLLLAYQPRRWEWKEE